MMKMLTHAALLFAALTLSAAAMADFSYGTLPITPQESATERDFAGTERITVPLVLMSPELYIGKRVTFVAAIQATEQWHRLFDFHNTRNSIDVSTKALTPFQLNELDHACSRLVCSGEFSGTIGTFEARGMEWITFRIESWR
jgi:hypothetical protein